MSDINREIPLVILEGTPRHRRRIHGEMRKAGILSLIEKWKIYLDNSNNADPETYIEQFLEETDFVKAVKRWTPELLEEVEGIGEGAGVDFKTIFSLQLADEEWWYHKGRNDLRSSRIGFNAKRCSSIGIQGQEELPSYVAQNMDLPVYYDGHQVLLRVKDHEKDHESIVFSVDGMIALAGINNRGIGICCNALEQLNHSKDGLPVAFVHRGVLSKSKFDDAIDFVFQIKHASGQNYVIGDPKRLIGLECSANKVIQQLPDPKNPILCHTNHPLVNNDVLFYSNPENSVRKSDNNDALSDTEIRLNTLADKLNSCSTPIKVEEIKSILSSHEPPDHPICRHLNLDTDPMTLGFLIMELSPSPTLYFSSNPPCSRMLTSYRF